MEERRMAFRRSYSIRNRGNSHVRLFSGTYQSDDLKVAQGNQGITSLLRTVFYRDRKYDLSSDPTQLCLRPAHLLSLSGS